MIKERINVTFSSIRHPKSNGIVERPMKTIAAIFRIYVANTHSSWETYVKTVRDIINETWQKSSGYCPMELQVNIKPTRLCQKYLKPMKLNGEEPRETAILIARKRLLSKAEKRKEKANRALKGHFNRVRGRTRSSRIGELSIRCTNKEISKFFEVYEGP